MNDHEQVIDWSARGFFRFPEGEEFLRTDARFRDEWDRFAEVLSLLKAGSFGHEEEMWAASRSAKSWQVSGAYAYLIGHTADFAFLQRLFPLTSRTDEVVASGEAAECLAHGGLLSAIPALLNYVDVYRPDGEYETIYWFIHQLIDDGRSGFPMPTTQELKYEDVFQEFADAVRRRFAELRDDLGTTSIRILRGKALAMRDLVDQMRQEADSTGKFPNSLRQIFEAMTGINCTDFFRDHKKNPLGIHAILDDFEESGQVETFVTGKRYFFAHPVPDGR